MFTQSLVLPGLLGTALLAVLGTSACFDLREERIPDWITAGGLIGALLLRAAIGPAALGIGVMGGALGFSLGILLFAGGAMSAGDGMLMTAVGVFLGFDTFLHSLPLIAVFGGVLAVAVTVRRGTLTSTLFRFRDLALYLGSFGRIGNRPMLSTAGAVTIPYGIAVAAGAFMGLIGWGLTL